jgi:aryl-alcohol dehydrogenase-like predicted oxidoreductase
MTTEWDEIEHIRLGETELEISPLGVGTWAWGDRLIWGYDEGKEDHQKAARAFEATLAGGINFLDTAELYGFGHSEELVGQFIAQHTARERLVVTTKFFPYPWRWTRRSVLRALRGSLERLGLSRVGLYLIHHPWPPMRLDTWAEALADAVEEGLTRAVGVSNYSREQMCRTQEILARRGVELSANQVKYNLLERAPERNGLLETCRALGVTLIAYSPLEMGILTGKYTPEEPPPGVRGFLYNREKLGRAQRLVEHMREIGAAHGDRTAAQVALNWVICKGAVPIPGARLARHAAQNAEALGWRLTAEDVATLDELSARVNA